MIEAQQKKKIIHTAVGLTSGPGLKGLVNKEVFKKKWYLVIRSIQTYDLRERQLEKGNYSDSVLDIKPIQNV